MIKQKNENFIDSSVHRKKRNIESKVETYDGVPVFSLLEFNIFGACNRSCSFCPVSDTSFFKNQYKGIDLKLYEKIICELRDISYSGDILYSAFSEPLLNKEVYDLIKTTKRYLSRVNVEIVSNGDVILKNKTILNKLFDNGLDVLSISIYDGPKEYDEFQCIIKEKKLDDGRVILRRRYKQDGNYGLTISNRAGLIDSNKFRAQNEDKVEVDSLPLKKACFYPFYQMVVDYDGDVLMCSHDWKKEKVIGNANETNIFNIWKGEQINRARLLLKNKSRNFSPCNNCDIKGDVMGKPNFDAWVNKI